jgi:hypothetical protein
MSDSENGGAMPVAAKPSRRLFLAAGSAAAIFATLKSASAGQGAEADAELLAIGDQLARADEVEDRAHAAHSIAEDKFYAAKPPAPIEPEVDVSGEEWLKALQAKMASDKERGPTPEQAAFEQAKADHEKECERIRLDCGLAAAEEAQREASIAAMEIRDAIAGIQATTLTGLMFKARYAARDGNNCFYDSEIMFSIVSDLLAMSGEA